jgi:hypothetical protein
MSGSLAHAQPSLTPSVAPLSEDEAQLLTRGEISDGAYYGGAIVATFGGFGIGQAMQGRWHDTGWIFTVGDLASTSAFVIGLSEAFRDCGFEDHCRGDNWWVIGGLLSFSAFRVWGALDAWIAPPLHNRKVRALRERLGQPATPAYTMMPYVAPTARGDAVAGVMLRF